MIANISQTVSFGTQYNAKPSRVSLKMNCAKRDQLEKVFSELNRQVIDAWEQVRLEGVGGAEYRRKTATARLLDRRRSNALRNWNSHVMEHRCHDDSAAQPN
jgi:hypothetical protein